MRGIFILLCLFNTFLLSAQVAVKQEDSLRNLSLKAKDGLIKEERQLNYFVIKAKQNTYGYAIYADGKLFIYQETIPGLDGPLGFKDTLSASKTAQLVIDKIKKGGTQPEISLDEMKMLNIDLDH